MAIKEEELSEEQRQALNKLYWGFRTKNAIAIALYVGFLLFANFIIILINQMYVHSDQFQFLTCISGALFTVTGLRGTLNEQRDTLVNEIEKIVGHL